MQEVHSVPYAGHLGYQKTLKKIQQNFYWPDHTLDVREFVLSCPVCQEEKKRTSTTSRSSAATQSSRRKMDRRQSRLHHGTTEI